MNTRISMIRKDSGLSMERFGKRIGITKSSVSLLESGKNSPSEQTLKLICKEFNVNYQWLTQGVGTMYELTDSASMARIDAIMTGENEFAKKIFREFSRLGKEEWILLEKIIKNISNEL